MLAVLLYFLLHTLWATAQNVTAIPLLLEENRILKYRILPLQRAQEHQRLLARSLAQPDAAIRLRRVFRGEDPAGGRVFHLDSPLLRRAFSLPIQRPPVSYAPPT